MASQGSYNWGILRHYWPTGRLLPVSGIGGEAIHFALVDAAGVRVPNVANTSVQIDIVPLDISALAYAKSATFTQSGGPNGDGGATWQNLTNGNYCLRMYGFDTAAPHNKDLLYTGRYTVAIKYVSGVAAFEPIFGLYDVRADWDIEFSCAYVPGSSGDDAIKGCVDIFHWWNRARLDPDDVGLTQVEISMRDVAGTNWLSVKKSLGDFTVVNGHLWFNKTIDAGIPGGEVLLVEVALIYNGIPYAKQFAVPVRY